MQHTVIKNGKEFDCGDIAITTDMWYGFLKHEKAKLYLDALIAFLREPNHESSCYLVGQKFSKDPQHFNAKMTNFGKWVNSQLDDFSMIGADGERTYWAIPMRYGWDTKNGFVWQLRDELVEALQKLLLEGLIDEFRDGNGYPVSDETYKWKLLQDSDGKSNIEIAKALRSQNIVDNPRVDSVLKYLWENKAGEFDTCINNLFDETITLKTRIAEYKETMRNLCPQEWNNSANDERTAAAFLTCRFPQTYTFYKEEVYSVICGYLGIEKRKSVGLKYEHFMQIIDAITEKYGDEIQHIVSKDIESFSIKPKNLAVQTLFWCLKDEMNKEMKAIKVEEETVMEKELDTQKYIDLLKANHNIILNGAPGTGKTYLAKKIAEEMGAEVKMVQFHPSYDYTDFVEGLRPIKDDGGNIGFERKDGVFKNFCKMALADQEQDFVFIIDEINRGEISKIFGELFFSLDPGYRGEKGKVQTQYQNLVEEGDVFKDGFFVPENVYIIGTMNDIDRSVESMDFAMRRRFVWHEVTAEESAKNMKIEGELLERMNCLNQVIGETEGLGCSYHVGGSMFLKIQSGEMTVEELWNLNLKSLMKEYLRGIPDADDVLKKMEDAYFLKEKSDLGGDIDEDIDE